MEIVYVYQKLRKDFGRAPKFTDLPADTLSETLPNPDMMMEYVERNPTDVGIQCIPEFSEHEVRRMLACDGEVVLTLSKGQHREV